MARSRRTDARRLGETALLLAFAAAALAAAARSESTDSPLVFQRHGEPVARHTRAELEGLATRATVRVHEPYEEREVAFAALPFAAVLDAVYTPSWRREEEILFTCRDGYQPTVPVARALAHRAWLAFGREDQEGFTILKRESGVRQTIELGPFYLVWENLEDATLRQEGDYGWPYQLVGIDLIRRRDRFPKMAPPPGAPPEVQAGFAAYRIHCAKCHTLLGEGGAIGPELMADGGPLGVRGRDWLRRWIEAPESMRPGTRMPPIDPDLPERARTVDAILAYLEAKRAAPAPGD